MTKKVDNMLCIKRKIQRKRKIQKEKERYKEKGRYTTKKKDTKKKEIKKNHTKKSRIFTVPERCLLNIERGGLAAQRGRTIGQIIVIHRIKYKYKYVQIQIQIQMI